MDPDQHLIEELTEELGRALRSVHLEPEFRQGLKQRLLDTPTSRWRRWMSLGPQSRWGRGALAGVTLGAVALAVAVPLALSQPAPARHAPQFLVMIPPGTSAPNSRAQVAAPAPCLGAALELTVAPSRVTLAPGEIAHFDIFETGGACSPQTSVRGPSAAGLSVEPVAISPGSLGAAAARATYQITWTGRSVVVRRGTKLVAPSRSSPSGELAPGNYLVTVEVPHTSARASIDITIRK